MNDEFPPLPESLCCAWLHESNGGTTAPGPMIGVGYLVNAFPWPAGLKSAVDAADWRERGFWDAPLFTEDQMRAYARAAMQEQKP